MPFGSSGDVYVLADEYGRVLVEHVEDGDYYRCVAWVDGETRFDFDSASDTELVNLMKNRGFVEGLTIGENLEVTVNIGRLTETYVWDAEKAEFDYDFDSWVNGSRTLTTKWFTKSDGTPELVVVNSASEPVYFYAGDEGTQRCLVVNNPGDEEQYFSLDLASEHPELTSWHSVDCFESTAPGEGMATLNIVNFGPDDNIFVMNINEDGAYREGSAQLPVQPRPLFAVNISDKVMLGPEANKVFVISDNVGNPPFVFEVVKKDHNYSVNGKEYEFNIGVTIPNDMKQSISCTKTGNVYAFEYNGQPYTISLVDSVWVITPNVEILG